MSKHVILSNPRLIRVGVIVGIFAAIMLFFDENNLISRFRLKRELHLLNQSIQYYEGEIEACEQTLIDIESSDDELERFAREKYYMKAPDEDIFLLKDE